MRFLLNVVVSAVAVWVVDALFTGIRVRGPGTSTLTVVLTYLVVGLVLAAVNGIVKPIVKTLTFVAYVLTLGLFSLVVNAAMLELAAWIARHTSITFTIDRFWPTAVLAALVVAIITALLGGLLRGRDDDRA